MPISTLLSYEPMDTFRDKAYYWKEYIDFYELYWGGPTSPYGVWFGNEYEAFRNAISSHLEIDESEIEDCFFMKDNAGKYYIAPTNSRANLLFSENIIPFYWFLLFGKEERAVLITRWGFSAIYYDTRVNSALERNKRAQGILKSFLDSGNDNLSDTGLSALYKEILNGLKVLEDWLNGFNPLGFIVLNYGEICSLIHPSTINNEHSVGEIWDNFHLLEKKSFDKASTSMNILLQKWQELNKKASGGEDNISIQ